MMQKKISFVIPCYASEHTISLVVQEIITTMDDLQQYSWELVLVNDCSPDNTFEVIRNLCISNPNIIGINLARNFGQHAALMAGFNQVSGDIIVCMDDDEQTPGNEVGKLLEKIEEGYDVAYARYVSKKHSIFRNIGSRINSKMTEFLLDKPKDLYISSYFAIRRYIVDEMVKYDHSFPYVIGLVLRSTKNIANVDVTHRERQEGSSGYSIQKLLSLWMNGFTAFSVKPLRLASLLGLILAAVGFISTIILVLNKLAHPSEVMLGWSSTMAVMMLIGGVLLIVLGIIGEYIGRIYICINKSPQYIIREKVQGKKSSESLF
ncbi:glycosyltransferase family 2 protein [uncultured Acetatifactor sp.]|jgi:glycosyltransferase involved in cell wall biosynthesis|uniref:glycosyltransferase family 2 protein n=2 Tax=uncultured Acetatifactor sp. TaxID=1671927 RepID=UPI002618F838|nr:glycosyltransferase family 2 protein [uncultured Acetatifactor sp.]MCI9571490.1 glycosyltransferase family 2 protein [Lachnospiraceae bacterium]